MTPPAIILSAPQMGENIGAAARIMLNFGFTDLRIINPRDGWPNPKAFDMAKGAKSVLEKAQLFSTLSEACEGITTLYATTVRQRDMVKPCLSSEECAQKIAQSTSSKSAILFGAERTGLANDEITLAQAIVTIPVEPLYNSLNLAQSVAIMVYSVAMQLKKQPVSEFAIAQTASRTEIAGFLDQLTNALDDTDFFRIADKRAKMLHNIHNIFTRYPYSEQEIRTLRGMVKAFSKKS